MSRVESEAAHAIGERIRALRAEIGATRQWLAAHAGVEQSSVGKYETGKALPNLANLVRIAEALEVDPGELIRGLTSTQFPPGRPDPLPVREYVTERRQRLNDEAE